MRTNHVQYLLMGGQACVLYGAAEFSRDADRLYWQPLRLELQRLRQEARESS